MADTSKTNAPITVAEKPLDEHATQPEDQGHRKEKKTLSARLDDWYIWEVFGVFLSAGCILTIVGLLIWLDKKPLPQWGFTTPEKIINGRIIPEKRVNIALNSVISWISTVGKICILIPITKGLGQLKWVWFAESERRLDDLEKFDSATRGLTGSAKLLWRLKGQHFATIGAIAIILALGFDPFIQNLIHYDTVYAPDANDYNDIKATPVFDYRGVFGELDSYGKAALYAGLYGSDTPTYRVPQYTCNTGNCTWSDYPTLAIGVHCAELTSQLTRTCSNDTTSNSTFGPACDYTLPNGMNLGTDGRTLLALNTSREALVYTNYSNPLSIIQAIGAFRNNFVNESAEVSALECVMFPAVKTYFSAVGKWYTEPWDANHTSGEEVGPLRTPDQYFETTVDMFETYTYVESDNSSDNNPLSAGYFLTPPSTTALNSMLASSGNEYRMSNKAVVALQRYLRATLQGFVRSTEGSDTFTSSAELNGGGSSDALSVIYNEEGSSTTCRYVANYWGQFSTIDKNVQCALDSMAASFSTYMRYAQNVTMVPGDQPVSTFGFTNGTTIAPITQVNVTWWWIVLPIIIWLCSVAMVIGTAVKSKRAKVHLWRTNPLAMVFLTLGRDERAEVSQHGGLSEQGLIQRAENIKVKLSVQDGQDIMLRRPRPQNVE